MLQRISVLFIPEPALSCLNSDPVLGRIGQVADKIKCVMLFPEFFICSESKITGPRLFEQYFLAEFSPRRFIAL